MDAQQSRYIDKYQQNLIRGQDIDEDELFAELEDELENDHNNISAYREQRLQQLSNEFKSISNSRIDINSKYGNVKTITDEKEVIRETTSSNYTIIHFFKQDFKTCMVMDSKLAKISIKHLSTNFLRCDVIKSPFLVNKLNIKILPCVVVYINGIERDRIVGFERLGSNDGIDFKVENLEMLLFNLGVINKHTTSSTNTNNTLRNNFTNNRHNDDDDSDLDL